MLLTAYFAFFCFFLFGGYVFLKGRPLTPEIIEEIKREGLYHITRKQNVPLILSGKTAYFKPSSKWDSYSNGFKESVFFFVGKPDRLRFFFNLYPKKGEWVSLRIKDETIINEMLPKMKYRIFDKVVMYEGGLRIPTDCIEVEEYKLRVGVMEENDL